MKKLVAAFVALEIATAIAFPQQKGQQRPARVLQDAVLGFYISQFQQQTEVSTETFAKILPFLQQFVQDRFEISQRRTRALNQLRQALNRSGSEDELKRLVRELDSADGEFQMNQQKFFSSVDPLLNIRQQAKVRILQNMADNRIRQMLNAVQNPAGQRQPPAPATGPN